ncbi:MAG TPA: sigma-54 dependent transcriptional regulator [Polyangiaceae bacterium]|nr:sigma-54 dependent transcriptional regulator [Polyangiaceae bacterium]
MTSPLPSVLVVDDHSNMLRLMTKVLSADVRVLTARGGREAIGLLGREQVSVILADLSMPEIDGLEVFRVCKQLQPDAHLILMTAYASVPSAVEALRLGVFEYLTKPFEPEMARSAVLRALGVAPSASSEASDEPLPGMLGVSAKMREVARLVRRFAPSTATALILGETGTGKERIARAMHALGARAGQRFVAVNCAAIPADLLESELFGFARGAFTGAVRERTGLFEEAASGTLFLDEIGEMQPSLQAKLTRTLEERSIRRLGESRERSVDVRVIAATHRDLEAMAKVGTFREDLWYRLNVATIQVPPLRERREDIELLATRFLRDFSAHLAGFTPLAMSALVHYSWPGNVRQLRAAIERASLVCNAQRVDIGHLPTQLKDPPPLLGAGVDLASLSWNDALAEARAGAARYYLEEVLRRHGGNVAEAAAHAEVERESYYRLLRRYGAGGEARRCSEPPAPPSLSDEGDEP